MSSKLYGKGDLDRKSFPGTQTAGVSPAFTVLQDHKAWVKLDMITFTF